MSSEAAGTMDDDQEVLKLQDKLSQCRLERERLLQEKKRWRIKEKLLQRGIEKVEEKLRVETESNSGATSEYEEKKMTLEQALKTKKMNVIELDKAMEKFLADTEVPYMEMGAELTKERDEYERLLDELNYIRDCKMAHEDIVRKLESQLDEKRNNLHAFLETCDQENSNISDHVKYLLQFHYDAFIDELKSDDDDWDRFIEQLYYALELDSDQKKHDMYFPSWVELISLVSAAIYVKNFKFLYKEKDGEYSYLAAITSHVLPKKIHADRSTRCQGQ